MSILEFWPWVSIFFVRHTWLVTNGFAQEQIQIFHELSFHEDCRRLLGPALPGKPKVDLQWQSAKTEATRTLISWIKQAIYSTTLDANLKQALKTTADPKDVIANTACLKEGLDELLAAFKKENGPKCPVADVEKPMAAAAAEATTSIELADLCTNDQLDGDVENELPRWVEFLEEVFDKFVTLVVYDPSSVTLGQNLLLGLYMLNV